MFFPGVLRGRPGPRLATIPTSRPRRSLSSPGMSLLQSSRATAAEAGARQKKRRGSDPLEEPTSSGSGALLGGWRGLTPRWPRSLRIGSASGSKLARTPGHCNPSRDSIPHIAQEMHQRISGPGHCTGARGVRRRLRVLRQWRHGQSRALPGCARTGRTGGAYPRGGAPGAPRREPVWSFGRP